MVDVEYRFQPDSRQLVTVSAVLHVPVGKGLTEEIYSVAQIVHPFAETPALRVPDALEFDQVATIMKRWAQRKSFVAEAFKGVL